MAANTPKFALGVTSNLKENLDTLPKRMKKAAIRRAMIKLAAPMVQSAQAGMSESVKTGRTQRRILVSATLSRRQRRASYQTESLITVHVGVGPSRKAHLIEFGSGPRYHKTGKYTGQMPANPFLRPAFDGGAQPYLTGLGQVLGEEVEKTAARYARKQMKKV